MSKFTLIEKDKAAGADDKIGSMKPCEPFSIQVMNELGIIHPAMEDGRLINAYRQLRTSLRSKMARFNSCILVSSIKQGGGASFTAMNLAAAFTFDHQKTALLVDCNLKRSVLGDRLHVDYDHGLRDYICGDIDDISDIVYSTGIPRLRLVPSGKGESQLVEFFTSEKMHYFLDDVRNRYPDRIIILDAPPVLESADTKILAELCDYVLLVLPYKGVSPSTVDKTLTAIDRRKVIGMVLNN